MRKRTIIQARELGNLIKQSEQRQQEQKFNMTEIKNLVESMIRKENRNSNFGKKQKKDIKGMLKKILLYGGLPLLLLVSLGVLSNTKLKGKQRKQNTKVEKDSNEIKFKENFKKMIEQVIIKKHDEFRKLDENKKQEMIATSKRQNSRGFTLNQIFTPEKPHPPSVSSVSTVEQKPLTKEQIRQQRIRKLNIRMKKNPPSPFDPNTYIKIPGNKESFSYVKEKKEANYRITEKDVIEHNTKSGWTPKKHIWDKTNEMIGFISGGKIIDIPVKLKKA